MKKVLLFVLCIWACCGTAYALEAPDLIFQPDPDGTYIYCNNHEFIRREDLADNSNFNAKFLMNNEGLGPDKYTIFVSHVNHTELRTDDGTAITEPGFDIEVDVLFRAQEDTVVRLTAVGFEVPDHIKYYYRGEAYTRELEWGCFQAWASYLGTTIYEFDSGQHYTPVSFEPVEFTIPAGEEVWLSSYIPNYREVPFYRPVHLMADFEILSGCADVNVAALKSLDTLRDRSRLAKNVAFGSYVSQKEYKGIADSKNVVDAYLHYTIDDTFLNGASLPVKVYNQFAPDGNEVTVWYTNLNPRADIWNKDNVAETGMLAFRYYDPSKLQYYGSLVPEEERDPNWYFDTTHADAITYSKDSGFTRGSFQPNFELQDTTPEEYGANLGNYGVLQNYHITITNNGYQDRYWYYTLNTAANNLILLYDENGALMEGYPLTKGTTGVKQKDVLACVKIPAMQTTSFTLCVVLTTNHLGGMENAFALYNTPVPVQSYPDVVAYDVKDKSFTGREYVKWQNGTLWTSEDGVHWAESGMNDQTKALFYGHWNEYRFIYTGTGYLAKPILYDGTPYDGAQELFNSYFQLDLQFNLVARRTLYNYPKELTAGNGLYYLQMGANYYSKDLQTWYVLELNSGLPVYNFGTFTAAQARDGILLSTDGLHFDKVVYELQKPLYIDTLGDLYYYINGKDICLSADGVYWHTVRSDETIYKIGRTGNALLINGGTSVSIPALRQQPVIQLQQRYLGMQTPPVWADGSIYVPLRSFAATAGFDLQWDADAEAAQLTARGVSLTFLERENLVLDGTLYVPVRKLAEALGYTVRYDEGSGVVVIE